MLVSHIHNNTFQFLNHIAMFKSLQVAIPCQGLIHKQFNYFQELWVCQTPAVQQHTYIMWL